MKSRERPRTPGTGFPFRCWLLKLGLVVAYVAIQMTPINVVAGASSNFQSPVLYNVGLARCTFVDHSRGVENFATTPISIWRRTRRLVTEIRYPVVLGSSPSGEIPNAAPTRIDGGFPTVIFAHGYDVTPDTYAALFDAWVRAGFVVVAPWFPDENAVAVAQQRGANTEGDLSNEPGDLAFVTNAAILASTTFSAGCPILYHLLNGSELALAGHSDGATAVGMLTYDHGLDPQGRNFADLRLGLNYRAIMIFSGSEDSSQAFATPAARPSLLLVHSLGDTCNPIRNGLRLYQGVHQSNKWFLELRTAHHLPPFDGSDHAAFLVVSATSVLFLQNALESPASPNDLTAYANQEPSVATMFHANPGPPLPTTKTTPLRCGPN